jgi:serine protease AprX
MKKFYLSILIVSVASASYAQNSRYTIQLKDKQGSAFSISQPASFLSAKSIQRRNRQKITIDATDLPVSAVYLDSISKVPGVVVINTSKWLNNILVQISDPAALAKINSFPFVAKSDRVTFHKNNAINSVISGKQEGYEDIKTPVASPVTSSTDTISYGLSFPQVHLHEGEFLHNLGYRGQGMTIAVLDAGFYHYQTNPAFDSLRANGRIQGTYDFVYNEPSVDEDHYHGSNCLSILAANRPGFIVGTAPDANYWLFKTEDVTSEKPVEEQYWIAAAERADSAGVDLISSSLGYSDFDDSTYNLTYAKRDGNTAPITIAADIAAKKGIIVMNSAGNSGNLTTDYKYVMCPADGDSVVAVGAVDANGNLSSYSSWGPNGAGKPKPNIVSVGWNTVYATASGNTATGSGTSYANPNIAGLMVCFWQAFPDFTNMEIIDAVQRSSDRYDHPDERFGYGIPNFRIAYNYLIVKREEKLNAALKNSWITAYPVPFQQSFTVYFKAPSSGNAFISLLDVSGRMIQTKNMQVQQNDYYTISMNPPALAAGIYYVHYNDGKNKTTLKLIRW